MREVFGLFADEGGAFDAGFGEKGVAVDHREISELADSVLRRAERGATFAFQRQPEGDRLRRRPEASQNLAFIVSSLVS